MVRATGLDLHFSFPMKKKNIGRTQCAHWVQQPATGRLHINGFESFTIPTKEGGRWASLFYWCGQQDSNLHAYAMEPKSTESTNSTMPADIS